MSKHTPGPWRICERGNIGNLVEGPSGKAPTYSGDDGYRGVATFQSCTAKMFAADEAENRLANGHLIAAAPDMLAALEALIASLPDQLSGKTASAVYGALDTIAKAKGV